MNLANNPNVVVLGGGTGMPVLLRGLKHYPLHLSAIVTVADDGGSTGRLRKDISIPAPGDIRNTIIAMANIDPELERLFQYRFHTNEYLAGHALGNIILAAMSKMTGDFYTGIKQICRLLQVKGNIYPVVNEPVTLNAVLEDGTIITGEKNIQYSNKKIKKIYLTPRELKPLDEVIDAILQAKVIIISPGSLYTSILPNLVISHVVEALKNSAANIVYVCNMMTQHGETNGYTVLDHIKAMTAHIGMNIVDTVIVHNEQIKTEVAKIYKEENATQVLYDKKELAAYGLHVIEDNIAQYSNGTIRHNTNKIAEILYDIVLKHK